MSLSIGDPAESSKRDPYSSLRNPNYRRFCLGWFIALLGTRIQSVAIGWEIYERTGQAKALALVAMMQAIPTMGLALPAGFLADRFPRRVIAQGSMIGTTLTSLGLCWLSYEQGPVNWMYPLLFLDATTMTLGRPARMAMLPGIVTREQFPNAIAWNSSMFQISSVAGPALGGLIIQLNIAGAYLFCALCSFAFVLLLLRVKVEEGPKVKQSPSLEALLVGARFIYRKRIILTIVALDMFAVLLGGATYLLPIFAKDILQVGETGFGWLRAAPAAGAFAMALLLAHLPPIRRAGQTLLLSVAGFGLATIVFGFSESFALSLFMLFLTGAFDNVSVVIRHTIVQLSTPDEVRGRVSAVNSVFISASNELGGMESGIVAAYFGPVFSVVSGGIGTLVVVGAMALFSPNLRKMGSLEEEGRK